jgi:hypothetical protein
MYKLFGLLICISLCIDFGLTASYTWTNTAGGSWSIASNWSPNGVPGANDDVTINSMEGVAQNAIITLGGSSVSVNSLTTNKNTATRFCLATVVLSL